MGIGVMVPLWLLSSFLFADTSDPGEGLSAVMRDSDLIALAEVKHVEIRIQTKQQTHYVLHCTLQKLLKGNKPEEPLKVYLTIPVEDTTENTQVTPPEKGTSCWFFLYGPHHHLRPVSPAGGIRQPEETDQAFQTELQKLVEKGPRIREVRLHVSVENGWSAYFQVHSGGRTHGGHVSGGDQVLVHMRDGRITEAEVLDEMVKLAEDVYDSNVPTDPVIRTKDLVYIRIETFDGSTKTYQKARKEEFANERLRTLEALLLEHRIGGW